MESKREITCLIKEFRNLSSLTADFSNLCNSEVLIKTRGIILIESMIDKKMLARERITVDLDNRYDMNSITAT